MRSFYLQFQVYSIEKWPSSGTYPLIYGNPRSFNMQIHHMRAYFLSPYLSHITRSTCTSNFCNLCHLTSQNEQQLFARNGHYFEVLCNLYCTSNL